MWLSAADMLALAAALMLSTPPPPEVTVLVSGDVTLGYHYEEYVTEKAKDVGWGFEKVGALTKKADLFVVNLECPFTARGEKIPKNVKRYDEFEFIDSIKGGVIPGEFIPAVEKGVREAMDRGIVAGYKMVNVSCELTYGSYHDVDSSEIAYKIAASMAFQDGAKRAKPVILEPIMKLEVVAPEKFMGDVTGSIMSKRGMIEGTNPKGQALSIIAKVPLSEMFGYTTALRSMTSGQGSAQMEFDHYEVVPPHVEKEIVAARK